MTAENRDPAGYRYWQDVPTRWKDNDQYGHVNNAVHYAIMDTAINTFLIERAGLEPTGDGPIGLCVSSRCDYLASVSFPEVIALGLRVARLGGSSVTYEAGLFRSSGNAAAEPGNPGEPIARGEFVHVFVDRDTRRPTPIAGALRDALETLQIQGDHA